MVAPSGWGLGCYHKESDGTDLTRKRIVLATFAGCFAEGRFCKERSYAIPAPTFGFATIAMGMRHARW